MIELVRGFINMKKSNILYRSTSSTKCAWCGNYEPVKFMKVSPKKEKPACFRCYDIMTWKFEPRELKVDELLPKWRLSREVGKLKINEL